MAWLSRIIIGVLILSLIAGVALAAFLVYSSVNTAPARPPAIEFSSVEVGDIVTVGVTARGERVTRAELWAGDTMLAREINPNPVLSNPWSLAWQWQPPAPGVYPLAARAYDEAGGYGASSLFNVVIPPKARLLFSSNRENEHALYELETDTRATGLWQPALSQNRQPTVSKEKIAVFASNQNNAWQLVSRALDNPQLTTLTPELTTAQRPTWSHDGKQLAFEVTDSSRATNIFLSDADGKNVRQVTNTDAYDGQASFNPSGDHLAFTARQGNQSDIYTVALDGSGLTRLTTDAAQEAQPDWAPDGYRIAYVSNHSGIAQIWVMNSDGSNPLQLTNIPSGAEQPRWSPDGNWLAFVAYSGGGEGADRREIYLLHAPPQGMSADQQSLIRLTQNDKEDTEPAWIVE